MRRRVFPIVLLCCACCAAAEPVRCPASISVRQQLAAEVPGWTALLDDTPHQLAGVTFYEGPPAEKASLVSDAGTRAGGKRTETWKFLPGRRIWLACGYAGTSVLLAKAVPSSVVSCSVTYDPRQHIAGLPAIEKITCK